jgi:hypothetical protein
VEVGTPWNGSDIQNTRVRAIIISAFFPSLVKGGNAVFSQVKLSLRSLLKTRIKAKKTTPVVSSVGKVIYLAHSK